MTNKNYTSKNLTVNFNLNKDTEMITLSGTAYYKLSYLAPKPLEKRLSYSGSGLPFANEDMAFDNTPSKGIINKGQFNIEIHYPNTHYEFCSENLLKPYIKFINLDNKTIANDHVVLGEPLIYNRSLMELSNSINHRRTTFGGNGSGGKN